MKFLWLGKKKSVFHVEHFYKSLTFFEYSVFHSGYWEDKVETKKMGSSQTVISNIIEYAGIGGLGGRLF